MDCSMPGLPVLNHLPKLVLTHVHWISDAIQPSCPLSSPSPAFNIFANIRVFSRKSVLHIRWPKYWSFSFSISPSNEFSGLISFRMYWFDLLAVQVSLKSLLQHHSSKASILRCSAFFMVQISHPFMTTGKIITLITRTFVRKVMSLLFNMLSRLVITFLPGEFPGYSHCPQWLWSQRKYSVTVSIVSQSNCHEVMGPIAMIFSFWKLSFKPVFSLSFHLHQEAV